MHTSANSRPLDALATTLIVVLCLSWGLNQVAVKVAIPEIPPLLQSAARSAIAALIVGAWASWRGMPMLRRDGTLLAGLAAGALFALEFLLIYRGLLWTTATRAVFFLYLAPFFVMVASRWLIPGDHLRISQWAGLSLSFVGVVIAFGLPTPAADPRQLIGDLMMLVAAAAWAATTIIIKVTALNRVSAEKTMLYQLVVSAPLLALAAGIYGERIEAVPSGLALGAFAYQVIWVVSITYVVWFALIVRYSATRLSAFTFLTPLFGVAAGHFILNEPLTLAFAVAVVLVVLGLVLVNRPR